MLINSTLNSQIHKSNHSHFNYYGKFQLYETKQKDQTWFRIVPLAPPIGLSQKTSGLETHGERAAIYFPLNLDGWQIGTAILELSCLFYC